MFPSQENMDLSHSGRYWNVTARLLECVHWSWPWKRDATVSGYYALMMMMMMLMSLQRCAQQS